jgi:hypothetical protein
MRKYENVDVAAALGAVMEINTEYYKEDFKQDMEMFRKAARIPEGEDGRLLWLSRRNGTVCFRERDVYLIESHAHSSWTFYADRLSETPRAYAVTVTGMEHGRIKGDLYELDYRAHVAEVKKNALHVATVSMRYTDGAEFRLPYEEWDGRRERLYIEHGELETFRREPKDVGSLRQTLREARERREKEARPAVFKVRVGTQKKPSIRQQIAKGKEQISRSRADAPERAAGRPSHGLEV